MLQEKLRISDLYNLFPKREENLSLVTVSGNAWRHMVAIPHHSLLFLPTKLLIEIELVPGLSIKGKSWKWEN